MVLYLDFDGVLHPDEVYLKNGRPTLEGEFAQKGLFCWAPILEDLLADFPDVKIKLSTSWVQIKGFNYTKNVLPAGLQCRVIGATYHKTYKDYFEGLDRFKQIWGDVRRNGYKDWIAIDNDTWGWREEYAVNLVETQNDHGISDPLAQMHLIEKLLHDKTPRVTPASYSINELLNNCVGQDPAKKRAWLATERTEFGGVAALQLMRSQGGLKKILAYLQTCAP